MLTIKLSRPVDGMATSMCMYLYGTETSKLHNVTIISTENHSVTGSLLGPDSLRFFLTFENVFSDFGIGFAVTDNGFNVISIYRYLNYVVQHDIAIFKRVKGVGKVEGLDSFNLSVLFWHT